jgi:hypothetical protein
MKADNNDSDGFADFANFDQVRNACKLLGVANKSKQNVEQFLFYQCLFDISNINYIFRLPVSHLASNNNISAMVN